MATSASESDNTRPRTLGVVLAGGASRRFGAPKMLARVGGRRIVDRVRHALATVSSDVVLVANDGAFGVATGMETRADEVPGLGPLAGVRTALFWAAERGMDGALVAACDLPFVPGPLFGALLDRAAGAVDAVVPESAGRRGVEPLCAWYSVRCLEAVETLLAEGERSVHRLAERVRTTSLPLSAIACFGDPRILFLNVNTVDDLKEAERLAGPPVLCIVGKKNSGKTTLTVALLAELKRRGRRVASIKHGHHAFETDQPGRDSWRHFNEGMAEATLMAGTGKVALVLRIDGEPDPERLVREFYAGRGYDLVLIEGYKHGPFPRVEVYRTAAHAAPIHDPRDPDPLLMAMVTDDAALASTVPVILFDPEDPQGTHVNAVADLVESRFLAGVADAE